MAAAMAGRFASRARAARHSFYSRGNASSSGGFRRHFYESSPKTGNFPNVPRFRREMVSLLPLHSATASARLVSLISGGSDSLEWFMHRDMAMAARVVVTGHISGPPVRTCGVSGRTKSPFAGARLGLNSDCGLSMRLASPLSAVPKKRSGGAVKLNNGFLMHIQGFGHLGRVKDDG